MYVSCGLDELYGRGRYALTDDLENQSQIIEKNASEYGIRRIAQLFPDEAYTWPESADAFLQDMEFTQGLVNFYNGVAEKHVPASILYHIQDAYLSGSLLYCGKSDSPKLIYETNRAPDRVVTRPIEASTFPSADPSLDRSDVDYLHLATSGSFNYGHWLVDDLPRVKAAFEITRRNNGRQLIFLMPSHGEQMNKVRLEGLSLILGYPAECIFYDPNRLYKISRLFFPTPVTYHPMDKSPSAMRYLAEVYRYQAQFSTGSICDTARTDKIFVARSPESGRSLSNFEEVWAILEGAGYMFVDPGKMSFTDQARVFARSRAIIGVMGAAMTNTLFCPPGTKTTYLAPHGWIETFYLDLAVVRQHRYRVIYGPTSQKDRLPHLSNFAITPDDIHRCLDDLANEK